MFYSLVMGALGPVTPWTPGDDVLLRRFYRGWGFLGIAGKRCSAFFRKFTVRDIQDRWYSLLYDPVVSAEAAFPQD
ncbi:hypothetical protein NC651_014392 [Populus alba x Populus x berolinensis]|nr:hypothetical protein NC651_014392 [Populus alba x Populus x berolinensis]